MAPQLRGDEEAVPYREVGLTPALGRRKIDRSADAARTRNRPQLFPTTRAISGDEYIAQPSAFSLQPVPVLLLAGHASDDLSQSAVD
jgi:hypothetical protein